jgi:hypothetical protein
MNGLSRQSVLEQIAAELADRRARSVRMHAAYIKLARAILADDDVATSPFLTEPVQEVRVRGAVLT